MDPLTEKIDKKDVLSFCKDMFTNTEKIRMIYKQALKKSYNRLFLFKCNGINKWLYNDLV